MPIRARRHADGGTSCGSTCSLRFPLMRRCVRRDRDDRVERARCPLRPDPASTSATSRRRVRSSSWARSQTVTTTSAVSVGASRCGVGSRRDRAQHVGPRRPRPGGHDRRGGCRPSVAVAPVRSATAPLRAVIEPSCGCTRTTPDRTASARQAELGGHAAHQPDVATSTVTRRHEPLDQANRLRARRGDGPTDSMARSNRLPNSFGERSVTAKSSTIANRTGSPSAAWTAARRVRECSILRTLLTQHPLRQSMFTSVPCLDLAGKRPGTPGPLAFGRPSRRFDGWLSA